MEKLFVITVLTVSMTVIACRSQLGEAEKDKYREGPLHVRLTKNNGIYSYYLLNKEYPVKNSDTEAIERLKKTFFILDDAIDGKIDKKGVNPFDKEENLSIALKINVQLERRKGRNTLQINKRDVPLNGLSEADIKALWEGFDQISEAVFPKSESRENLFWGRLLRSNLVKDKLVLKDRYVVRISNDKMVVNGKNMPDGVRDKYVALCQDFENKKVINWKTDGDLASHELSVSND
jgi:hypothetical protein